MSEITAQAPTTYTVHPGDPLPDRDTVIAIWQGNLGQPSHHASKFDWFYLGCPWGRPMLQLLRHEPSAEWIGTCAAGPRRMLWQGREIHAGVLVDMAVAARHRTLGPAMFLQAALVAAAPAQFDLLYGFPNRKALPVVKRLGYTVLCQMPRFSCVLRYREYLERVVPHLLIPPLAWLLDNLRIGSERLRTQRDPTLVSTWQDHVDPRMDELWHQSAHGSGPIAIRDTMFLRWRFDESPLVRTRYLLLCEKHDRGTLRAWFACQTAGGVLHVRDFWSREAAEGMQRAHIHALLRAARRDGYSAVSIEYAGAPASLAGWLAAGFHEREHRPVIGRWLDTTGNAMEATHLHLTAADEDE